MIKLFMCSVVLLVSFFAGMIVTHYKIFPYDHIKLIKQRLFPTIEQTQHQISYHARKLSQHTLLNGQEFDMVFVGDSLTGEANWAELFPSKRVANLGINADTTQGLINRLDTLVSIDTPRLFMMIGVNDIFQHRDIESIENNYRLLVERLGGEGKTLYLFSCLYLGPLYQQYNPTVIRLNAFIRRLADSADNVVYVELNEALALGSQLNPAYTNDDLHLNGEAYAIWKGVIDQYNKK